MTHQSAKERICSRRVARLTVGITALGCVAFTGAPHRPNRTFRLRFQLNDYVVPAGEIWRLSWKSPYQLGDICPVYDVQVAAGEVYLGANREIQAQVYDPRSEASSRLDLSATKDTAVAWLGPGTKFHAANELLQIEVSTRVANESIP